MIVLFFLLHFATADVALTRAQGLFSAQNSGNYRGQIYSLGAAATVDPSWGIALGGDALTRTYNDGTRVSDALFDLGGVWKPTTDVYVLGDLYQSSDAEIFARTAISVAPHYVIDEHDFGLAVRYNDYRKLRAGSISPSYFYSLTDTSGFGVAAFVVRTEKFIGAVQAQALLKPFARHDFRFVGATGRALEDAGVEARFDSLSVEWGYLLTPRWRLQLAYTDYASDIRREHSYGIGLGWR